MEYAVRVMPRALQRDLIHYKIIFKSRLGRSVESDMIKFQVSEKINYTRIHLEQWVSQQALI